jgi:hypothetical protein
MFTVFRWTTTAVGLLFTVHTIVSPVRASSNRRFSVYRRNSRLEGGRGRERGWEEGGGGGRGGGRKSKFP